MKMGVGFALMLAGVLVSAPVQADDDIGVAPDEGGFLTSVTDQFAGSSSIGSGQTVGAPHEDLGTHLLDGFCVGINWTAGCVPPDDVADVPDSSTPDIVLAAFRRISLPEAELVIQPPNGRTLVNFDTNFYTDQGEFTRTVTLLGRQVELRIWPESFAWRFGDGEVEETSSPGAPYPDLEITHAYRAKGQFTPSVDTTYAAQFRVGGGPWQDVAGTVTIAGTPQQLRVVTARPVLVGG